MTKALISLVLLVSIVGCEQKPQEAAATAVAPKQYRVLYLTDSGITDSQKTPFPPKDGLLLTAIEIHIPPGMTPYTLLEKTPAEFIGTRLKSFSLRWVVPGRPKAIDVEIAAEADWIDTEEAETARPVPTRNCAIVNFIDHDVMVTKTGLRDSSRDGKHRAALLNVHRGLTFEIVARAIETLKSSGFEKFCFSLVK